NRLALVKNEMITKDQTIINKVIKLLSKRMTDEIKKTVMNERIQFINIINKYENNFKKEIDEDDVDNGTVSESSEDDNINIKCKKVCIKLPKFNKHNHKNHAKNVVYDKLCLDNIMKSHNNIYQYKD